LEPLNGDHYIGAGTHKRFDLQVLFRGIKEDFDLPAVPIGGD
jgi:hypothetical protein